MSSKIRVAVIGAGKMGGLHARVLSRMPGVELAAVADSSAWRAQFAGWKHSAKAVRDYREALAVADAVVVAVPTPLHYEVGRAALEAGLHCLIEKPLASSLDEARALLELSEKKKLTLQVGHIERFNPAVLAAIPHVHRPRFVTGERLGPYDPRMSHIGVVLDLMIHDLDILLTLIGDDIESLEAVGTNVLSEHEDIANVRIRFKGGCVADLTASRISLEKSRKLRFFQEDSYISLDYGRTALKIYKKKRPVIKSFADIERVNPNLSGKEPLVSEHEHWLDCIRHHRKPWPSAERGLAAMRLAFQISEELERYHASGSPSPRRLSPERAQGLG